MKARTALSGRKREGGAIIIGAVMSGEGQL